MSVTTGQTDGVTDPLTSDLQSPCPPLCQIIKGLCYSPVCCSVSQRLKSVQRTSQSVLGALHIMIGLFNIGLGAILTVRSSPYPFWLGGMFLLFGIVSILSEKFPSPCLVLLNVILNLAGVGFAAAAIILYSIDIALLSLWWLCDDDYSSLDMTPSPDEKDIMEKCLEGKALLLMTMRGIIGVLIILSVLELCVTISSAVLGIKDLKNKTENKSTGTGRMSVTMANTDGVTVYTLTSDPQSHCPPLCQILMGLCYSPVCCSVSQHMKSVRRTSQSVLGALHIMVGLLNIGFGAFLFTNGRISSWEIVDTGFVFWVGGLFILFGVVSILTDKYPSPCLVLVNVILNLAGVAFAIAAIVLYSINLSFIWLQWMCNDDYSYYGSYYDRPKPSPSPREQLILKKCEDGETLVLMLVRSMNVVLIVLAVLEFSVALSSAVLGIKALCSIEKPVRTSIDDPEYYKTTAGGSHQ